MARKYTEANKRATIKYISENLDRIEIRRKKGEKEKIKVFAEKQGESVNSFINKLIDEAMGEKER